MSVEANWTNDRAVSLKDRLLFYKQIAAYRFACGYLKGRTVMDVGCGSGYGADLMSKYASLVVGYDPNEQAIAYCRERYPRPNLSFVTRASGAFDVVTAMQVLEHQKDPEHFLTVFSRSTSDLLIVSTPNAALRWLRRGEVPWNDDHKREYYADELEALLKKHFSEVQMGGIHGSVDATMCERTRISGRQDPVIPLSRRDDEWDINDFTVGPVEGSLDLLAVCR